MFVFQTRIDKQSVQDKKQAAALFKMVIIGAIGVLILRDGCRGDRHVLVNPWKGFVELLSDVVVPRNQMKWRFEIR